MPTLFYREIIEQPAALERLMSAYAGAEAHRLAGLPAPRRPWLVGMGASYHAALIAAGAFEARGLEARAFEASEVLHGGAVSLEHANPLIYISQSGASAEVEPLLARLPRGTPVVALTNDEASPLARRAQVVLPLLAGDEHTVATKTYTNSLALLWLMLGHWMGRESAAFDALHAVHGRLARLLANPAALAERWIARLGAAQVFAYAGTGPWAVSARHAAMMTLEWLKAPAMYFSVGGFRHGPLEIAQSGLGAVLLAGAGPAGEPARRLAQQLESYGAAMLFVEDGEAGLPANGAPAPPLEPMPAQILAVAPVQVFIEALAAQRGVPPGFRHIGKVVTDL